MGWTETFGTGKCCILWWLSCVADVDRGGEGNGGKKREGMGERRKGLPLPFPFRAFLPSPPLPSLFLHLPRRVYGDMLPVQAMKKYDIVVRDFWIRSLSRTEFLTQTCPIQTFFRFHWQSLFPYNPDIRTQTHGPRGKKADCPPGQTSSVYCIGRQYLTLTVIVQLFELTKGINSLLVCCFSWPSGRQLKK